MRSMRSIDAFDAFDRCVRSIDRSRSIGVDAFDRSRSIGVDAFDAFDRSESIDRSSRTRIITRQQSSVIASSPSPSSIIGRYPHPRATDDDDDVSIVGDDVFVDRDAFVERSDRRALS